MSPSKAAEVAAAKAEEKEAEARKAEVREAAEATASVSRVAHVHPYVADITLPGSLEDGGRVPPGSCDFLTCVFVLSAIR